MNHKLNRILAILLSCAMLLGMTPALAEEAAEPAAVSVEVSAPAAAAPEAPAAAPEAPAAEPEAPAAEPEAPAAEPEAPAAAPEAPAAEPEAPAAEPEAPAAEPEAPAAEPEAPAAEPEAPAAEPEAPAAEPETPATEPEAPADEALDEMPVMLMSDAALLSDVFVETLEINSYEDLYYYGGNMESPDYGYLYYRLSPYDASDSRVRWTSSDPSVVRIDTEITDRNSSWVNYTAVGMGTATITGTALDGSGVSGSVEITVSQRLADEISIGKDTIDLWYDGTGYLDECEINCGFSPWYTTDRRVEWTSSNPGVVRVEVEEYVNGDGYKTSKAIVKGVAPGEATITARALDGSGVSASRKVLVYQKPKIYSVSFSKNPVLLGETVTVDVCTSAEGARKLTYGFRYYETGDRKYLGETTQKTVRDGKAYWSFQVTPEAAVGTAVEIEMNFISPSGWSEDWLYEYAYIMVADKNLKPTGIKVYGPDSQGVGALSVGDTFQMPFYLQPEGSYATIRWKSSNGAVATVNSAGLVTATGEGSATITATTDNGKKANAIVRVLDPNNPTAVNLDKTGTVNVKLGDALTLTPSLTPATAQATYSWSSSSAKVATVSNGVITPTGEGTATITVTATRGKIKKTAAVKVNVYDPCKPTSVALDKTGTVSLNLGDTLTLTPSLAPATA